jgi:hypothetical protein
MRSRYGEPSNRSPRLFGISLYQPKHLELALSGRKPFNPRTLFAGLGIADATSPYLSQVPCSWGAVYFPEHWRAFHDYLSLRRGGAGEGVDVVKNVRSNRWTRSWKRFFIELVYVRGWVMLYPNFGEAGSLSTNHLEEGSHVRSVVSEEKKALFRVPLMPVRVGGLGLGRERMPRWEEMPVLDLVGDVGSLRELGRRGEERWREVFG